MGHELGNPMNHNGVVQAVQNQGDEFYAVCDSRKEGFPDGFWVANCQFLEFQNAEK